MPRDKKLVHRSTSDIEDEDVELDDVDLVDGDQPGSAHPGSGQPGGCCGVQPDSVQPSGCCGDQQSRCKQERSKFLKQAIFTKLENLKKQRSKN